MYQGVIGMSRVQLALNVSDLDAAIEFYSKLFGTQPAKTRPGYANFAIGEPPLKLVLIEGVGQPGSLNHLGVEVGSTDEVTAAQARLTGAGLACATEDEVECCYALQDKVWVGAPGGEPWEFYTVLADSDVAGALSNDKDRSTAACCTSGIEVGATTSGCC